MEKASKLQYVRRANEQGLRTLKGRVYRTGLSEQEFPPDESSKHALGHGAFCRKY